MKKKYPLYTAKLSFAFLFLLLSIASFSNTSENNSTNTVKKGSINIFAPTITTQPTPATTICVDQPLSLDVVATGAGVLTYQWQFNGTNIVDDAIISGSTSNNLMISSIQLVDTGNYTCIVTDGADTLTATSNIALVTVNPLPTVDAGTDFDVCIGDEITLSGSGTAITYTWTNGVTDNVAFTPTISATYTVTGTDALGCENTDDITVNVVPTVKGFVKTPYDIEVCKDATPQDIIFVGSDGTTPYTFTYEITSPVLGSPITGSVTSTGNEAVLTPQISTSSPGVFTVELLTVQDDTGFCNSNEIIAPSQAFVTVLEAGIVPVNLADVNQTICEDETITSINFEINGSPTNAYVDGLPGNVTSEYFPDPTPGNPGILTISGTPNEFGIFNYTVITSGSSVGCNSTFDGTFTINETGKLSLFVPNSNIQSVCTDTAISDITYSIQGGATGASVVFTPAAPAGITYSVSATTVVISGTPTEGGIFDFSVETFSGINSCTQAIETGSIAVQESEILLGSGSSDQTVCIDNPIEDINFNINSTPVVSAETMVLTGPLPTGVTFDSVTGLLSGTPSEGGTFPYSIESSTGCALPYTGEIIVNDIPPTVLIENGLSEINVCEGSEITLTATGGDTYEWYYIDTNNNTVLLAKTNAYTYSPIENQTIFVIGTQIDGCSNTAEINVLLKPTISASIVGVNSYEVCKDDSNLPTITFTGSEGLTPYIFTYSLNGVNYTISSIASSESAVISIPTNIAGTIDVELLNVEDSNSPYCNAPLLFEPLTATVTIIDSNIYPKSGAQIYQTICQDEPLNTISFDIDASNAYAEGLPSGVTSSFASNVLTISGTPTVGGSFDYTVITSGQTVSCPSTFSANITVIEKDILTPISVPLLDQIICSCDTIEPILFELGGGATGATVTGLPSGISWNTNNGLLTISGVSCDIGGDYTYTVTTQGACENAISSGTISIKDPNSIALTNGVADELACANTPLTTPIQYQSIPGQTLVLNGVLPAGLTFTTDLATGSGVIDGTPTTSGYFEYSITSDSTCSDELEGSILVEDAAFINYIDGGLNQISCIDNPMEPIRYKVPVNIVDSDITFTPALPTGVTYATVNGELIISGTSSTEVPETSYQISVNSQCGVATSDFTFTFIDTPEIIFESDSGASTQAVCQNNVIVPIRFKLNASATGIDESLLPSFISVSYDDSTGIYELTGAPQSTGEFNFDIKTLGDSTCIAIESVTISNLYAAISVTLDAGSNHQTLCSFNTPMEDIIYNVTGNFPNTNILDIVGLPQGIVVTKVPTNTGILITLSGQPSSAGIYNYELVYNSCGTIKNGIIEVSSPMTVNGTVQPISCQGNDGEISVELFGGVPFVDINGQSYYNVIWNGPNGFRQNQTAITGLLPGQYILSGTDAVGCAIPSETFTIDPAEPISITLVSTTNGSCDDVSGCTNFEYLGGTGIYTSFLLEYSNTQSQTWEVITAQNSNYYNICGLEAGLYRVSVTDSNNCASSPFLFTVEESSELAFENVVLNDSFCSGEAGTVLVELSATSANLNFTYNGQAVTSTALGNGFYELQVSPTNGNGSIAATNDEGCTVSQEITIDQIEPEFEYTSLEFERFGYYEVNSDIEFTNSNFVDDSSFNPNDYSYVEWDFGDNSPRKTFFYPNDLIANQNGESIKTVFHRYTNDGIYDVTLTLYNSAGCSKTVEKTIIVGEGSSIMLPTAFSPNNDGTNDHFRPLFRGVTEIAMYIYDNWGNLVYDYTSTDATVIETDNQWGWDGIEPKNSDSKNGSYRCYIVAKTLDEKTIEKTGRFLIIK